ncbi:MAG: flotillin-like FloA family protein [Candidatus Hydrogenedentota bacterium]
MSGEIVGLIFVGLSIMAGLGVGCVIYLYFFRLWFRTHVAQCSLPLMTIFGLFFRRVSPQIVVNSYIDLHKAGMMVRVDELETLSKDGGHVREVARAMVAAKKHGHEVGFEEARSIDLAGKDVMREIGSGAELSTAAD